MDCMLFQIEFKMHLQLKHIQFHASFIISFCRQFFEKGKWLRNTANEWHHAQPKFVAINQSLHLVLTAVS